MKLEGDYFFEAPIQEVWNALFDPRVLAAVLPGCEKLDRVDDHYVGELGIKVGPIQGKFSGKVALSDVNEPTSYTMGIDGKGSQGFVKATARVSLESEAQGTRLTYSADAQVGGKIASVGQRLVEVTAKTVAKQSLEGLHENVKIRMAASLLAAAAKAETLPPSPVKASSAEPPAAEPTSEPPSAEPPAASDAEEPAQTLEGTSSADAEGAASEALEEPASETDDAQGREPIQNISPYPMPVLKKVDQGALAAAVAKEVTKTLLPPPLRWALVLLLLALVVWLLFGRGNAVENGPPVKGLENSQHANSRSFLV